MQTRAPLQLWSTSSGQGLSLWAYWSSTDIPDSPGTTGETAPVRLPQCHLCQFGGGAQQVTSTCHATPRAKERTNVQKLSSDLHMANAHYNIHASARGHTYTHKLFYLKVTMGAADMVQLLRRALADLSSFPSTHIRLFATTVTPSTDPVTFLGLQKLLRVLRHTKSLRTTVP